MRSIGVSLVEIGIGATGYEALMHRVRVRVRVSVAVRVGPTSALLRVTRPFSAGCTRAEAARFG